MFPCRLDCAVACGGGALVPTFLADGFVTAGAAEEVEAAAGVLITESLVWSEFGPMETGSPIFSGH